MSSAWRLSGYRVESLLGVGAFGEVWRGTVRATGAGVALKKIRMSDPARREAALSEAALLGALDHSNLIRLHRLERVDGAVVLVLDLAEGGSLHDLLSARGRLTTGEVVTAMSSVGSALAHAHAAGVVHGDVTPANVLFSGEGLPLLGDLGVARVVGDHKPVHTTLPYAAPEVAAGSLPDPASDVYMLGAVTLHALTGHPPPSSAGEVDPDAWSARVLALLTRADVPPAAAAVVCRALSLESLRRGTSAGFALDIRHAGTPVAVELAAGRARVEPSLARLAAIAAGRSAGTGEPLPGRPPITVGARLPSPMPTAARHRARRRSILLPAAALVAAGAVFSAVAWWGGSRDEPGGTTAARVGRPVASSPSASPHPPHVAQPRPSGPPDVATTLRALAALDARRAAAFATRDPQRLADVYSSPTLLARDSAALTSLVPPGCGLRGVRTTFTGLRIATADAATVRLTITAAVRPSVLVCGGQPAGHAPGTAPAAVRLTLDRSGPRWVIASQRPVST